MNETTATALAYGIYKTDLPEGDPVNVVFVDLGFASTQVRSRAPQQGEAQSKATTEQHTAERCACHHVTYV